MKNVFFQSGRRIAVGGPSTDPPRQYVSRQELWGMFTDAEKEAMSVSTNAKVQAFIVGMLMTGSIPVASLNDSLGCLADGGILTAQRRAELVNALG